MKDESPGKVMYEMVFLRPKMYYYTTFTAHGTRNEGKEDHVKKGKGIPKLALTECTPDKYQEALLKPIQGQVESTAIRSVKHDIYTMLILKKGLSGFDLKRYILPDGVNTLPYGHKDIALQDNRRKEGKRQVPNNALCT